MTTPKSGKARSVEMSAGLAEVLKAEAARAREAAAAECARALDPSAWVFIDRDGGRLDGDAFRRNVWAPLLRKLGLRHRRIHDLRHTFAVLHIQDGRSLAWVKDQLGHSSIQITVDIYGRWIPTSDRSGADRLDSIAPPKAAEGPQPSATPAQPNQLSHLSGGDATEKDAAKTVEKSWRRVDSNHGPRDYETLALAT